ncbi:hypothetical protein [Polaribacter sp. 20A6]|nr:hypothetical protein [Polaribacter sp. 20A6]
MLTLPGCIIPKSFNPPISITTFSLSCDIDTYQNFSFWNQQTKNTILN